MLSVKCIYLVESGSQLRTTGGSHVRNIAIRVSKTANIHDVTINISVFGGFSLIFFVSQPPMKLPKHTDKIPVTAVNQIKYELRHRISYKIACTPSEDKDQPTLPSLRCPPEEHFFSLRVEPFSEWT